jgi:hypothetical protein
MRVGEADGELPDRAENAVVDHDSFYAALRSVDKARWAAMSEFVVMMA